MDVEHSVGGVVQRSRSPETAVTVPQLAGLRPLELGRVAAVEDDRRILAEQRLEPLVGGGAAGAQGFSCVWRLAHHCFLSATER